MKARTPSFFEDQRLSMEDSIALTIQSLRAFRHQSSPLGLCIQRGQGFDDGYDAGRARHRLGPGACA